MTHPVQSLPAHLLLGQVIVHWGLLHSSWHWEVSNGLHRVSQRGGSQIGAQTASHTGLSHVHLHTGLQGSACSARKLPRTWKRAASRGRSRPRRFSPGRSWTAAYPRRGARQVPPARGCSW